MARHRPAHARSGLGRYTPPGRIRPAHAAPPVPSHLARRAGVLLGTGVLASAPEFVALRAAIAALPRDIREKLWVTAQIGRGDLAIRDCTGALDAASALTDDDIVANLLDEADLHDCLRKGLYELGAAMPPGDAR